MSDVVCVQNFYNVMHRDDDALIDELARAGIPYVAYFPLGGFAQLQSSTLFQIAERLSATPMQVALAWVLRRSSNILPIPGTSSLKHLRENMAAASLQLPATALEELASLTRAPFSSIDPADSTNRNLRPTDRG